MEKFETVSHIRDFLQPIKRSGKKIGFVPTMGALHEGHISLIKEARNDTDVVVCSIFVNPKQFNNPEDLEKYPRDIARDIHLLEIADCDVVFIPSEQEIYPDDKSENFDFGLLENVMEGTFRPGHFNGVATVVKRLFEIVDPDNAYFGLKDYQQLLIVYKMTKDLKLPVEIIPCPIVREKNGLAMSSRNERLSAEEREQATLLYETLKMVKIRSGYASVGEISSFVEQQFRRNKFVKLEYFEIVDMYTLQPLKTWASSNNVIACIAAWVGPVRLIDNMIIFS
ncbi:MAG: pantoate--beta-alanine ligase [Bacteroidales bacterium]|nr:pantoate--beta-alanine ligase [Bacteroidales bacterium]